MNVYLKCQKCQEEFWNIKMVILSDGSRVCESCYNSSKEQQNKSKN